MLKLLGNMSIITHTRSHHHHLALHMPTINQSGLEVAFLLLNGSDIGFIDIRNQLLLKPQTIVNEGLHLQRVMRCNSVCLEVMLEAMLLLGIGEIQGPPIGSQEHSLGHMRAPHIERLPENSKIEPQMPHVCG